MYYLIHVFRSLIQAETYNIQQRVESTFSQSQIGHDEYDLLIIKITYAILNPGNYLFILYLLGI
jgi:hypothetical protein